VTNALFPRRIQYAFHATAEGFQIEPIQMAM
jgi:hypothetical protein